MNIWRRLGVSVLILTIFGIVISEVLKKNANIQSHKIPLSYILSGAGLLLWLEIHVLSRYSESSGMLSAAMAGVLTCFVIAAVFVEMTLAFIVPSVVSAMLMSLVLAWAIRPSRLQG